MILPKIFKKRRMVDFKVTVTYKGSVMLNDCDDEQIDSRIGEAIDEFIAEDPLAYRSLSYEITDISNEDITTNRLD